MKDQRSIEKKTLRNALFFLGLTICVSVLGILCIYNSENGFIQNNAVLFCIAVALSCCAAYGLCLTFLLKKKDILLRMSLSVYLFAIVILLILFILQKTGFFHIVRDEAAFQAYLEKSGRWMPFVYIALQYLQVVILPIPSVVSTVAGIAIFGPFLTFIYSLIGILLGSVTAFFIGKKLGSKAVAWMIGEDTLRNWQAKLKGKDNVLLTLMFLLPVFPDDVLCFVAGLSTMSTRYFLTMIVVSRIISVSTTCYSFGFIPFDTWWGIAIWVVLFAGLGILFWWANKNLDKLKAWQDKILHRFKKKK